MSVTVTPAVVVPSATTEVGEADTVDTPALTAARLTVRELEATPVRRSPVAVIVVVSAFFRVVPAVIVASPAVKVTAVV